MKFKKNSNNNDKQGPSALSIISDEVSSAQKTKSVKSSKFSISELRQKSLASSSYKGAKEQPWMTTYHPSDDTSNDSDSHTTTSIESEISHTSTSTEVEGLSDRSEDYQTQSVSRKLSVIKEEESMSGTIDISTFNLVTGGNMSNPVESIFNDLSKSTFTKEIPTKGKLKCRCETCHPQISTVTDLSTTKSIVTPIPYSFEESSDYTFSSESSTLDMDNSGTEYFIFTIIGLRPTKRLLELKNSANAKFDEFVIKWNFLRYPDKLFFSDLQDEPTYTFNYQRMYAFDITPGVYLYLQNCVIPLELYVKWDDDRCSMIGRAELRLNEALKNPNRPLEATLGINNKQLRLCGLNTPYTNYGDVFCRFTIGGDYHKIQASKPKTPHLNVIPAKGDGSYKDALKGTFNPGLGSNFANINEVELKAFETGLNLILIRNAALRVTQEDISNELKQRANWMHQELLWKLTLQENAILGGTDPAAVRWRQWKDEYISHVKYRPTGNEQFHKEQKVDFEICIVELQINPLSRIISDESIIQLYVEYAFLNYTGIYLETPCQVKPDSDAPILYNFRKTFSIDKNDKVARLLADMIKNNEAITFTVVSEPLPNLNSCETCVDIGSCQLSMFDLVQNSTDVLSKYFTVYDHWDDAELGKLKIDVKGIFSIRSLGLHILTPETFNIIR